jgi:molybdopterin-biosynthesis enzyme MoeA-like protein
VIPDVTETIVATIREVSAKFTYVFTTGGIGPTHDDITAEAVARAFGVALVLDPEARRRIAERYAARGIELNEARLRMAHVPAGAALIDNPVSAAPGFRIGNVFVMAGVPSVARAMFEGIKGSLAGGRSMLSRKVTCDLMEGTIAERLGAIQAAHDGVSIGSYPFWTPAGSGVSLVLRGPDAAALDRATEEVVEMVRGFGGEPSELPAG